MDTQSKTSFDMNIYLMGNALKTDPRTAVYQRREWKKLPKNVVYLQFKYYTVVSYNFDKKYND